MTDTVAHVTDTSLDVEVLQRPGLTLLDFWADWCSPCKTLAPLLEEIAADYAGELQVAKINADQNKASAERFTVRGLPTLILFADGVEVERLVGLISKTRLGALLDHHLDPRA
jgi:thioredoxin 1